MKQEKPIIEYDPYGHTGNIFWILGEVNKIMRKQRRIIRAAQLFLLKHPQFVDAPCRFDVVDASGDPQSPTLEWIRDAFRVDG